MSGGVFFLETGRKDELSATEASSAREFVDLSRFALSLQFVRQSSASSLRAFKSN